MCVDEGCWIGTTLYTIGYIGGVLKIEGDTGRKG